MNAELMLARVLGLRPRGNALAMRPVQRRHVQETAKLLRASASQKKLGRALDLDQSNASRLATGRTASPLARCAQDLEQLEGSGIDTTALLVYLRRVARDARAAFQGRQP